MLVERNKMSSIEDGYCFPKPSRKSEREASFAASDGTAFAIIESMRGKGYVVQLDNGLDGTWEAQFYKPTLYGSTNEDLEKTYGAGDTLLIAVTEASLHPVVMPQWDIQLFYTFPESPRWESKEIFNGTEADAEKRAKELWEADHTANDYVALPNTPDVTEQPAAPTAVQCSALLADVRNIYRRSLDMGVLFCKDDAKYRESHGATESLWKAMDHLMRLESANAALCHPADNAGGAHGKQSKSL